MTIDHQGSEAVYRQLASILRDRIADGTYPPGRLLPARHRLAHEFGVSRGSAERALAVLREEGLVETSQGRGVFVVRLP